MAPKTPQTGRKDDRYQEQGRTSTKASEAGKSPQQNLGSKSGSPQHQGPRMNPGDNQTAATSGPATKHSQSSDRQPISASSASLIPRQASGMKTWLSRPFMPDRIEVKKLLITISPSDTHFVKHIHWSDSSNIFLVEYKGQECILKVFHENEERGMADDGRRDFDRYRSEARAYVNLKKSGLCDRGIVPKLYGLVESLDPKIFERELRSFLRDKHFPNAILLEYLPDASSMNYLNYSEERMNIAIEGMQQIHELASVQHRDTHARNILLVPGPPERVLWTDFDIAVSFKDQSELTAKDEERMDLELDIVKGLFELLAEDHKLGWPKDSRGF